MPVVTPNITVAEPAHLDASRAIASMIEYMSLQQNMYHIRPVDGNTPLLKYFLLDIANGAVYITIETQPAFIKAMLNKLTGTVRESIRNKQFGTVKELVAHLRQIFAPNKTYLEKKYPHPDSRNEMMKPLTNTALK